MRFLKKKVDFFFKIAKGGKFAIESVSNGIISLECLSCLNCEVLLAKKQESFKRNMMKKECFLQEKKRFHFFENCDNRK